MKKLLILMFIIVTLSSCTKIYGIYENYYSDNKIIIFIILLILGIIWNEALKS